MLLKYLPKNDKGEEKQLKKKRTFIYNFWGRGFNMLPNSYTFSHGVCLNIFLQVWLIGNQRYQVNQFRYINQDDGVSHLVRRRKVLGGTKYPTRSVKRAA